LIVVVVDCCGVIVAFTYDAHDVVSATNTKCGTLVVVEKKVVYLEYPDAWSAALSVLRVL
jgi:hypothetical protein